MLGMLKCLAFVAPTSGVLFAQMEACGPYFLGAGSTINLPGLVVLATVTPEIGAAGICPSGPCTVRYRVDVDVWASPTSSPGIKPELCFGHMPLTSPSANCWPTSLPAVGGVANSFAIHEALAASLKCGDWVDAELNFNVQGPFPGMNVVLNIVTVHAECTGCGGV